MLLFSATFLGAGSKNTHEKEKEILGHNLCIIPCKQVPESKFKYIFFFTAHKMVSRITSRFSDRPLPICQFIAIIGDRRIQRC